MKRVGKINKSTIHNTSSVLRIMIHPSLSKVRWIRVQHLTETWVIRRSAVRFRPMYMFTCIYSDEGVHAHTHAHCIWGTRYAPRGLDEAPGGPKKSRWTKFQHMCTCICVLRTHVNICIGRRDDTLARD